MIGFAEIPHTPFTGALNTNILVEDGRGDRYLKRYPHSNRDVMDFIAQEQSFIGFTQQGGRFRRRTPEEQAGFTKAAASHGLRVLPTALTDREGVNYHQFIPNAQTLDTYLPVASTENTQRITLQILEDLHAAHHKGFVYGDRWSENILVTPDHDFTHIDFDLEIYGSGARELDVASIAFYTLCGGRDKAASFLGTMLGRATDGWFNMPLVEQFTTRLAVQFADHPVYGNAVEDTVELFSIARSEEYARKS